MLNLWRISAMGVLCALSACGVLVPPAQPLPPISAELVVDVGGVPDRALTEEFARIAEWPNPCGNFPGKLSFGAHAGLLRVECLPDGRNSMSASGITEYVSAPNGAPWRIAMDLSTGGELARLERFTTCSDELDQLELVLGQGRAVFSCVVDRELPVDNWRIVSVRPSAPIFSETILYTTQYRFVPIGEAIVRQSHGERDSTEIPNAEVSFPFQDGEFVWRSLSLPDNIAIDCAHAGNASIDGRRVVLSAGRRKQEGSGERAFTRCTELGGLAIEPITGEAIFLPGGMFGRLNSSNDILISRHRGSTWRTQDALYYVGRPDGSIPVAFVSGEAWRPLPLLRIAAIAGGRFIIFEATPLLHVGANRSFQYVVFDWTGRPLAKFVAQRVAAAPESARLVVLQGDRLEVWDLRS